MRMRPPALSCQASASFDWSTVENSIAAFDALDWNSDGMVAPDEITDVERAPIPLDLKACIIRELRLGAGGERVTELPGVKLRDLEVDPAALFSSDSR